MLGDSGRSFVVGFGENYPKQPHHKAASCDSPPAQCSWDTFNNVAQDNPHELLGALVGGPKDLGDTYQDLRTDYITNEVTLDYNAGFQGVVAGLKSKACGGSSTSESSPTSESTGEPTVTEAPVTTTPAITNPPTTSTASPLSTTSSSTSTCSAERYDYGRVLELSNLFYEAQRSGDLPDDNRVPWRGDSSLNDQGQNGEDLTGGYHDGITYLTLEDNPF